MDKSMKIRVIKIAADLAHEIVRLVFVTILGGKMEAQKREDVNEQDLNIVIESIGLLLHVTDRLAFSLIPSLRALFMNTCTWNAWSYLVGEMIDADESRREEISRGLVEEHNERQIEYAEYQWPIEDDQFRKSVYWEFGKRLAKVQGDEEDFVVVTQESMRATNWVQVMIETLNIVERLGEISRLTTKKKKSKG